MTGSIINISLSFLLPISFAAVIMHRWDRTAVGVFTGAFASMLFSQLVDLLLFRTTFNAMGWYFMLRMASPAGLALFHGFMVSAFSMTGRLLLLRLFMRKNRRIVDGIAFGAGFGGIEVILAVGVDAVTKLFLFGAAPDGAAAALSGAGCAAMLMAAVAWSVMAHHTVVTKSPYMFIAAVVLSTAYETFMFYFKNIAPMSMLTLTVISLAVTAGVMLLCCYLCGRLRKT